MLLLHATTTAWTLPDCEGSYHDGVPPGWTDRPPVTAAPRCPAGPGSPARSPPATGRARSSSPGPRPVRTAPRCFPGRSRSTDRVGLRLNGAPTPPRQQRLLRVLRRGLPGARGPRGGAGRTRQPARRPRGLVGGDRTGRRGPSDAEHDHPGVPLPWDPLGGWSAGTAPAERRIGARGTSRGGGLQRGGQHLRRLRQLGRCVDGRWRHPPTARERRADTVPLPMPAPNQNVRAHGLVEVLDTRG